MGWSERGFDEQLWKTIVACITNPHMDMHNNVRPPGAT